MGKKDYTKVSAVAFLVDNYRAKVKNSQVHLAHQPGNGGWGAIDYLKKNTNLSIKIKGKLV